MARKPIGINNGITPLQRWREYDGNIRDSRLEGHHRVEVEHLLRVGNASVQEMAGIHAAGIRANAASNSRIANAIESQTTGFMSSVEDLRSSCTEGLSSVRDAVGSLQNAVETGNLASQALLVEIWKGVNPEGYRLAMESRRAYENEQRRFAQVSGEYSQARKYFEDAVREDNQSKRMIMLEESEACFTRATSETDLAIDAHTQLATLYLHRDQNLDKGEEHLKKAKGSLMSLQWVRISRMEANLVDYYRGNFQKGYDRINPIVEHFSALEEMSDRILDIQSGDDWDIKRQKLQRLLEGFAKVSSLTGAIAEIRNLVDRQRTFTALEAIQQNGRDMANAILNLRPNHDVLTDAARFANRLGKDSEARALLERRFKLLPNNLDARRFFLIEAMSSPDLNYD